MSESSGSGFSWFLAGLGIGSLIGVLYAPKSGAETREELVAGAMGKTEYLKQRASEVGDQVGEYVQQAKGQVTDYVGKGKDYVDASKGKLTDVVAQGKNLVNEHTTKVAAAYEAGKQAYVQTTVEPVPTGQSFE
ncbi:MAG TPA: YtxH domain-containing protein [Acidobacteriaceae bacterium]